MSVQRDAGGGGEGGGNGGGVDRTVQLGVEPLQGMKTMLLVVELTSMQAPSWVRTMGPPTAHEMAMLELAESVRTSAPQPHGGTL